MIRTHFLHVGKAGGSSIKTALRDVAAQYGIVMTKGHDTRLMDCPTGDGVFFCVRPAVERFVSAFNSRLRKGRPLHNNEWRPIEAKAFANFPTPNDLAEALSSTDPQVLANAHEAMDGIGHIRRRMSHWLIDVSYLESRAQDIVMVLYQPELASDFEMLKQKLGLPAATNLPADELHQHKTPADFATALSPTGRKNVAAWYSGDQPLLDACLDIRARILATSRQSP